MKIRLVTAQETINLVAGLIGMLFDRLEGEIDGQMAAEPDDLTLINGIGPTFAQRLNEAGVTTFAQLAALRPEQVRTMTQAAEWQGDPEAWVEEARSRA
ncbi:MAG: hypothetical protein ACWGPS_02835 [Candidatus Promineifilaceae bacterium]